MSSVAVGETIKPFSTDGCSVFPDGDLKDSSKWMSCCIRHDYAYWKGGTEEEREQADTELKSCVQDLGEDGIASLMYLGVRLGGDPLFPTWYRWGYGWPYTRGYTELSVEEKKQIKKRMREFKDLIDSLVE